MAESGQGQWHRVCLNTIVRKNMALDSERLRILPMGSRVCVAQTQGRRVRITSPIPGWCSIQSSNGDTILSPLQDSADVPATPKVNKGEHYQNKIKQAEELLAKPDLSDDKKKELKQTIAYNNERQQQYKEQIEEIDAQLKDVPENHSTQFPINTACSYGGGNMGVIRWVSGDEAVVGVETQPGAGLSNGNYNGEQKFKVPEKTAIFVEAEKISKVIPAITLLKKLMNVSNELTATRKYWKELSGHFTEACQILDDNKLLPEKFRHKVGQEGAGDK